MDIGSRRPLGAGATGIAFLAALPDLEVRQILEKVSDRLARAAARPMADIEAAIVESRPLGYALAADEPLGRIIGLAVPLMSRHGRPLGTLSLSGIPERFPSGRLPELLALLNEQARVLDETVRRMPEGERHRNHWSDGAVDRRVRGAKVRALL